MTKEETGPHLGYLDGWRGIAVSSVIVGHFWADDHIWPEISSTGVLLFFVLSGRLMAEILFVRNTDLGLFFSRRFSRVYPGIFIFVLLTTIALWTTPYAHHFGAAFLALTFTLNYAMIYSHRVAALDHLWSLCVEEHAYVILAAVAFLYRRVHFPIRAALLGLGIAAVVNAVVRIEILGEPASLVHWRSDVAAAPIFLAGGLWLYLRDIRTHSWLAPIALVAAIWCKFSSYEVISFGLSTFLIAVSIVTLDYAINTFRICLSHPAVRQIGIWSYSIYLWQQPFYKLSRDSIAPTFMLLGGAFICALASFYLVERPAREWINRRYKARTLRTG